MKLALDSFYGFSSFPIKLVSGIGILTSFASVLLLIVTLVRKCMGIITAEGYASLLIILLMGIGLIMLSLGVIGEYIWRIYDATRKRPPFIIDEQK